MNANAAVIEGEGARPVKKSMLWAGRVVSAVPILMLLLSASMKLSHQPVIVEGFKHFGFPPSALIGIGLLELFCVLLYAIPATSVLGVVLVTAYLGGAVATHVRAGEAFVTPVVLGMLAWLGLYLRDPRLRALLPFRTR
ncbi:MAG: rane protein [bacterium]|nr:rane protein [bacterium]